MPASPSTSVFINCPFDSEYQPIFEAIVFCVAECGFVPRCTLELTDAGEVRIENIYRLIAQCNHSIHDISQTEVEDQIIAQEAQLNPGQLTFIDYLQLVTSWLKLHR